MKGNKLLILIFGILLVLYIIVQLNKPKEFDWTPTLTAKDKNPFGAFVLSSQLKQLFPNAAVQSHRVPIYNVLHNKYETNSAYIIVTAEFSPGKTDIDEMLEYVRNGNTIMFSAFDAEKKLLDTLGLKLQQMAELLQTDSTTINFVNPSLQAKNYYGFKRSTIDGYFSEIKKKDSSVVLGIRKDSLPDFVKVQYGDGFFLVHAAPLCFSNYFMLYNNNKDYTAKALSYIPSGVETIHWDEYYKLGREGASTPLRFFLSDTFLRWALWLTISGLLIYIFFQMKRRQRIIPVIEPVRNTTLDFVDTVSSVYFSQHDNNSIAAKKIQFWYDHIRTRYYLSPQHADEAFVLQLQRKSGVSKDLIKIILENIKRAEAQPKVTDDLLAQLTSSIDEFYQLSKKII
ncbi:hypothetical protein FRZ67_02565 [Panacibacter ginsenosidivorans]|uniref:DUF4350 domain-containing protein n=1 Tax=Panacibacter ginsenosidivorans TaxID=1813871 RepID=A0A5B8V5Y4_9BACT|nr:DUF4350 domain-containing protein [Panacibacter ginsenosidivorans]QEC66243.1 hypothetical protein FRZ67_02565 [Panacibacter ginsenosidivorans]